MNKVRLLSIIAVLILPIFLYSIASSNSLLGPGDPREGYETSDYETHSKSLQQRTGKKIDLYAMAKNPPLGLPVIPEQQDNPISRAGIELGRRLFFDRRLSLNNTISCAMCHVPEMGFAQNEVQTSIGFEGRSTRRNAPTLLNVAYKTRLFHEGRETRLEDQVWIPLLNRNEMANPSIGYVLNKIRRIKDYDGLFEKAFNRGPAIELVGRALAQYERVLLSGDSGFDRWYYRSDEQALSDAAKSGSKIFMGKGQCSSCHLIGKKVALFTDNLWHNTGIGYRESMYPTADKTRVQLAPGVFTQLNQSVIDRVTQTEKRK